MARNKFGLDFEGMEELIGKLDKLGGDALMKSATEDALIASKEYATAQVEKAIVNLPAKGRYSTGETKKSIDKSKTVTWDGLVGYVKVGFRFEESGLKSIYLTYGTVVNGTPRMQPVKGLKKALYQNQKEIGRIQADVIMARIKKELEG